MWKQLNYWDEHGNLIPHLTREQSEQRLAFIYTPKDSCVLELGARYGTVSCATNIILSNPKNHVVVEPDSTVWSALEYNKEINNCTFHIVKGFCSNKKLSLTGRGYCTRTIPDLQSNHPSFTLSELQSLVDKPFDTLIADCEGFLETFLDENPNLYDSLSTLIFEKDRPDVCDYTKIKLTLSSKGFEPVVEGFREVWKKSITE